MRLSIPISLGFGLILFVAACGETTQASDAADSLQNCIRENGGVEATDIGFDMNGSEVLAVRLDYDGKGNPLFDAFFDSCLSRVENDLGLTTTP